MHDAEKKMLAEVIMGRMINQFIVRTIVLSHCIEIKMRINCFIISIVGYFENYNHITSLTSVF